MNQESPAPHPRPAHSRVDIILVEPSHGGNVGSCARLLANFGGGKLILVRPYTGVLGEDGFWEEARRWAWRADRVMAEVQVVDSLEEASREHDLLVSTVPPYRTEKSIQTLDGVAAKLVPKEGKRTAWVFGSERDGLRPAERALCGFEVAIPTHPEQPDLNLAQTVALCLYSSWQAADKDEVPTGEQEDPARLALQEKFFEETYVILRKAGFLKEDNPHIARELRKLLAKARPTARELDLVKGLIGTLSKKNK